MYQSDKKIIKLSMIVLFFSLMVIYVLLYHIKGPQLKEILEHNAKKEYVSNKTNNQEITIKQVNNSGTKITKKNDKIKENQNIPFGFSQNINTNTGEKINTGQNNNTGKNIKINNTGKQINIKEKNKILTGTQEYFGPLEFIEKLGINYKYILKDKKDIYYVRIEPIYNFDQIAMKLGGSTYTIASEQEIISNKLFGNKITYINLPEYKNKLVIMLVEKQNETRLIGISYNIYHESKIYLQNIFNY